MPMNLVYSEDRQYNAGRHMMDEEIRHFLDTGETPNGASAKPKTDAEKLYELGKENEFLSKLVQLHGVHNEIRETAAEIDAERAERRKTVQLPPDVHVRLGLYASEMSVKTGQRVSLAQAVDMALNAVAATPVLPPSRLMLMAKLADVIEAEMPEAEGWTGHTVSEEATIDIDGEQVSMFDRNWAAARATRPSNRDTPIPMVEAKIIVVDMQTGEVVHRQGGTYVQ